MITIIEISQIVLILVAGFLVSYQMVWSILALKGEKKQSFKTVRNRKFAVILLANNEQEIVSKSLYSLSGLVYPKTMYDLFVIAEKRSGEFVSFARNLGATVFEVEPDEFNETQNSFDLIKDKVLNIDQSYEGLILFDAKSFVSGNYLEVMNYYLENGSKVIQSSSLLLPNPGRTGNKAACVDFVLNNYVKPLGKKTAGIGVIPWNNGTCFSLDVLDGIADKSELLDNIDHLGPTLQLEGVETTFAPEAWIFIEGPLDEDVGSNHFAKRTVSTFWGNLYKKQKIRFLDSFLEQITPSIANIITVAIVMMGVNLLLGFFGFLDIYFVGLWGSVGLLCLLHLAIGLVAAKANQKVTSLVSYWPSYVLGKVSDFLRQNLLKRSEKKLEPQKVAQRNDIVSGH